MFVPTRILVAAALLAAPLTAAAQTPAAPPAQGEHGGHHAGEHRDGPGRRGMHGPRGERHSPIAHLLADRERLALTDAQVQRLQAIERGLAERNGPVERQLEALRPQRPAGDSVRRERPRGERPQLTEAQRQEMQARRERARPLMEQIHTNTRTAMEQAREVLTEEQRAKLPQPGREGRGGRGPRGHGGGHDGQHGQHQGGEKGSR